MVSWYFSKNTLPYWCVLAIDCVIIVFAGFLATYFVQGGHSLSTNFWYHLRTWCLTLPFFVVGMRIFHTYSGIMRYSSTIDLMRQAFALINRIHTGFNCQGTHVIRFHHTFYPTSYVCSNVPPRPVRTMGFANSNKVSVVFISYNPII